MWSGNACHVSYVSLNWIMKILITKEGGCWISYAVGPQSLPPFPLPPKKRKKKTEKKMLGLLFKRLWELF